MDDINWDELLKKIEEGGYTHDALFRQLMDMVKSMLISKKSFAVALYEISQKYNVDESTIRDACQRRLSLKSIKDFKNLTKYPEDLMRLLNKKFPNRNQEINDLLK